MGMGIENPVGDDPFYNPGPELTKNRINFKFWIPGDIFLKFPKMLIKVKCRENLAHIKVSFILR
jgi:hypothetical protein